MGSIMTKYLVNNPNNTVFGCVRKESQLEHVESLGAKATVNLSEMARIVDTLIIAVKQRDIPNLLSKIGKSFRGCQLITLAAGLPLSYYESRTKLPVIRVMPNVLIEDDEVVMGLCANSKTRFNYVGKMESILGASKIRWMDEIEFNRFMITNSCSPAIYALLIKYIVSGYMDIGISEERAISQVKDVLPSVLSRINSKSDCHNMIGSVSSPAGVTERIIDRLGKEYHVESGIRSAIRIGLTRCNELDRVHDE